MLERGGGPVLAHGRTPPLGGWSRPVVRRLRHYQPRMVARGASDSPGGRHPQALACAGCWSSSSGCLDTSSTTCISEGGPRIARQVHIPTFADARWRRAATNDCCSERLSIASLLGSRCLRERTHDRQVLQGRSRNPRPCHFARRLQRLERTRRVRRRGRGMHPRLAILRRHGGVTRLQPRRESCRGLLLRPVPRRPAPRRWGVPRQRVPVGRFTRSGAQAGSTPMGWNAKAGAGGGHPRAGLGAVCRPPTPSVPCTSLPGPSKGRRPGCRSSVPPRGAGELRTHPLRSVRAGARASRSQPAPLESQPVQPPERAAAGQDGHPRTSQASAPGRPSRAASISSTAGVHPRNLSARRAALVRLGRKRRSPEGVLRVEFGVLRPHSPAE